jgi:putative FmdB family regulatory protein
VPVYDYRCSTCNAVTTIYRTVEARHDCPECSSCGAATEKVISAPSFVMPDIQPYRAVAGDRRWISSRSEHRQFLKEFGYEEVGNEGPSPSIKERADIGPSGKID